MRQRNNDIKIEHVSNIAITDDMGCMCVVAGANITLVRSVL